MVKSALEKIKLRKGKGGIPGLEGGTVSVGIQTLMIR